MTMAWRWYRWRGLVGLAWRGLEPNEDCCPLNAVYFGA